MTLKYTPFKIDEPIFKVMPSTRPSSTDYTYLRIYQPGGGTTFKYWRAHQSTRNPSDLEHINIFSIPSIIHNFAKQNTLQPKSIEYNNKTGAYITTKHMLTSLNNIGYISVYNDACTTKPKPLRSIARWLSNQPEVSISITPPTKMPAINLRKFMVPMDYSTRQLNKLIKRVQMDILLHKI